MSDPLVWRRSTRCESSACVEVAELDGDYLLRDGKNPVSPVLRFTREEWRAFVAGVRNGDFD